jgi:hypothetical protein
MTGSDDPGRLPKPYKGACANRASLLSSLTLRKPTPKSQTGPVKESSSLILTSWISVMGLFRKRMPEGLLRQNSMVRKNVELGGIVSGVGERIRKNCTLWANGRMSNPLYAMRVSPCANRLHPFSRYLRLDSPRGRPSG